ncbi:MAG: pyridoxamine 5'-phosphate oxidase family protein [Pseudomonadota bacterium]
MPETSPFRETDDDARALARQLIDGATYAALAITDADEAVPSVTRIALATDPEGAPLSLISTLSSHTAALDRDPVCALLVGEPGPTGDPLTHPRITLHARADILARDSEDHPMLREYYLAQRPKAKLYIDFGDFRLVRFAVTTALLNGGFGKAFKLSADDLVPR